MGAPAPASGAPREGYRYVPEDHYGIKARVRVALGVALTTQDFLFRTKGLLEEESLKRVLSLWVGTANLFRSTEGQENTNTKEEADNVEEAFAAALSRAGGPTTTKDAGVWAHGFGDSFEMEFRLSFQGKTITLEILGLPVELSWSTGEEVVDRIDRLNQFLEDKEAVESKEEETKAKMGEYLERLRGSLAETYGASDVRYEFSVDLGSVVW